jgi:hypothetical protein
MLVHTSQQGRAANQLDSRQAGGVGGGLQKQKAINA